MKYILNDDMIKEATEEYVAGENQSEKNRVECIIKDFFRHIRENYPLFIKQNGE